MGTSDPTQAPDPGNAATQEARGGGFTLSHALSLVLAVAITAAIIAFRQELARFAAYGYLGIFVITLVGNATVILPVPGLVAVFAGGTALNPWIVGLVAGVAQPIGELTGYLAGYGGAGVVENRASYQRVRRWMEQHGFLTIFVLAAIPNPVFDMAGIMAGALRMPVWQFLLACWLGKTIKALAIAWLGSQSVQWAAPLLRMLRIG